MCMCHLLVLITSLPFINTASCSCQLCDIWRVTRLFRSVSFMGSGKWMFSSLLEPVKVFYESVVRDKRVSFSLTPVMDFHNRGMQLGLFDTMGAGPQSCIPQLWISITGACNFDFESGRR